MDNKSKGNKLDNFIRSFGTVLPKDVLHYKSPDGDKRLLCPFCDSEHDDNPILRHDFAQSESGVVLDGTYSCDECNIVIERMETRILRGKVAQGRDSDAPYINTNARRHLFRYANEGILPPNSHLKYTHLNPDGALISADDLSRCVFCDKQVTEFQAASFHVQAPVGADIYHLDGGSLLTCTECYNDLTTINPDIAFDHWERQFFAETTCPKCHLHYLITKNEEEFRSIGKTVGLHLCPECAYNNLEGSDDAMFYARRQTTDGRYSRYVDVTPCAGCKETMTIDQTLCPDYVLRKHVSYSSLCYCSDCKDGEKFPFGSVVNGEVFWNFYFDSQEKVYALKRNKYGVPSERLEFKGLKALYEFFEDKL